MVERGPNAKSNEQISNDSTQMAGLPCNRPIRKKTSYYLISLWENETASGVGKGMAVPQPNEHIAFSLELKHFLHEGNTKSQVW